MKVILIVGLKIEGVSLATTNPSYKVRHITKANQLYGYYGATVLITDNGYSQLVRSKKLREEIGRMEHNNTVIRL